MAVNLRKPAKYPFTRWWKLGIKAQNTIVDNDGWIAYYILSGIMDDDAARKEFRNILESERDWNGYRDSADYLPIFEQAIRETISEWFYGELAYAEHEDLLTGIVANLLTDNDFIDLTETARALIYLLDKYAEPEEE